jgi:purine-binding chemotaxis protein CheW
VIPLPEAPLFVEGVINLRGQTLPLVDLRKRFGLTESRSEVGKIPPPPPFFKGGDRGDLETQESRERRRSERGRVLVIRIAGQPRGFLVDAVAGILRVPAASVEPPPLLGKQRATYLQGIARQGDRLVLLLDLEQVLTKEERLRLDEVLRRSSQESVGAVSRRRKKIAKRVPGVEGSRVRRKNRVNPRTLEPPEP